MKENPLYVPITLNVMLLGEPGLEKNLSSCTPNYRFLREDSLFGDELFAGQFATNAECRGAHLHWVMPDALLKGTQNEEGNLEFMELPNRWYVIRLTGSEDAVESKAWLVRSDVINSMDDAMTQEGIIKTALPCVRYNEKKGYWEPAGEDEAYYTYVGDVVCQEGEEEKASVGKLTAVTSGDYLFTAMYPNSKTIFGFYDSMNGIQEGTFTYLVCGYYACEESDPFSGKTGIDPDNNLFHWVWKGNVLPQCSLYHGVVWNVKWQGGNHCYQSEEPLQGELVLADTSAAALSCYIQKQCPEEESMERLLNALQAGILPEFDDKNLSDRLQNMEDGLHQRSFRYLEGGSRVFFKKSEECDKTGDFSLLQEEYQGFYALQDKLREWNEKKRIQSDYGKAVYLSWCRYQKEKLEAGSSQQEKELQKNLQSFESLGEELSGLESQVNQLRKDLQSQIAEKGITLETDRENFFVQPTPPVLMFIQKDSDRTYQQGFQGDNQGNLSCRILVVDQLDVFCGQQEIVLQEKDIQKAILPTNGMPLPDWLRPLFIETILLSGDFSVFLANVLKKKVGMEWKVDQLVECIESARRESLRPMEHSFYSWSMPWHPILMEWRCRLALPRSAGKTALSYYSLGDIDLEPNQESFGDKNLLVYGKMLMTPHAPLHLRECLQQLKGNYEEEDISKLEELCDRLENRQIISQQLEGFQDYFLGLQYVPAIPILPIPGDEDSERYASRVQQVMTKIYPISHSGLPVDYFMPIQGGYMKLDQIRLIDSFGQFREIQIEEENVFVGESMRTKEQAEAILPARFLEGIRLNWQWNWAQDISRESINEDTSPVLGFLLCDYLNQDMQIYDSTGTFLGWLEETKNGVRWQNTYFDEEEDGNREEISGYSKLLCLIESMSSWDIDTFRKVLSHMDAHFSSKRQKKHAMTGIANVMVLASASISVEEYGLPVEFWGEKRDSFAYQYGKFTLRIGDRLRDQDGVVAFLEDNGEEKDNFRVLHLCLAKEEAATEDNAVIQENEMMFSLSDFADNGRQDFVFFLDPYKAITITSGLMPVKKVQLTAELFERQLKNIRPYFLAAPILTPPQEISLPVNRLRGRTLDFMEIVSDDSFKAVRKKLKESGIGNLGPDIPQVIEGYLTWREEDEDGR